MGYTADPAAITAAGDAMTATVDGAASVHPQGRLEGIASSLPEGLSAGGAAQLRDQWEAQLTAWRTDAETYAQGLRDSATTVEVVDENTATGLQVAHRNPLIPEAV